VDVQNFAKYMLSTFGLENTPSPVRPGVTLVVRRSDRKIMNSEELFDTLKSNFSDVANVRKLYLEDLSHQEQFSLMRETTILIGIHGSGLTNLIFLPPGSVLLEIFQYGFTRPTYRYVSGLAGVLYLSWQNSKKEHTIFHSEILDSYQLSDSQRSIIVDASSFHHGMTWAGNMYWINQDTIVDVQEFVVVVREALQMGINKQIATFI